MLKIEDLLSNNFESYPKEVRCYLESFSNNLKEALKDELVESITEQMFKDAKKNKEDFKSKISNILIHGHNGYNNMCPRALVDLYLSIKGEAEFHLLLDKVSNEL